MSTIEIKPPGKLVGQAPEELLPIDPVKLAEAERNMDILRGMQDRADVLARKIVIRDSVGSLACTDKG